MFDLEEWEIEQYNNDRKDCCFWCGKEFKPDDKVITNEFLTGIFGYIYCSDICMNSHINSK